MLVGKAIFEQLIFRPLKMKTKKLCLNVLLLNELVFLNGLMLLLVG
jgi:hypothetical protein